MGLQVAPSFIGDSGFQTPVENDRKLVEYLAADRAGLLRAADFTVANVPGSMAVSISAGGAIVKGLTNNTQGSYFAWSNASENVAWPASAGSARYDTLIIRIVDTQYGADGTGSRAVWEVLSGTPAGSPTILTDTQIDASYPKPGAWIAVADVLVPAGATNLNSATITRRVPTTNRPSRYASNLGYTNFYAAHGVPASGKYPGERFWCVDTGLGYIWDGTTLRLENAASVRTPLIFGGTQTSGNDTLTASINTWVNIAGTGQVSSGSFTKLETTTRLKVSMSASFVGPASGTNTLVGFGVRINGVDYQVCQQDLKNPTVTIPIATSGIIAIGSSVVPAGVYTVQARWNRLAGATGTISRQSTNDGISVCVEEIN